MIVQFIIVQIPQILFFFSTQSRALWYQNTDFQLYPRYGTWKCSNQWQKKKNAWKNHLFDPSAVTSCIRCCSETERVLVWAAHNDHLVACSRFMGSISEQLRHLPYINEISRRILLWPLMECFKKCKIVSECRHKCSLTGDM